MLVVGPNPFLDAAFATISEAFPQAKLRKAEQPDINPLDGYRLLAKDECSRLGWRIVLACDVFDGSDDVLGDVTRDDTELVEALPDDYCDRHLALARLVACLLDDVDLEQEEIDRLAEATGLEFQEILQALNLAEKRQSADDDEDLVEGQGDSEDENGQGGDEPSIICTSLTGSKGLSAGYVFIVGFNNGHFPRDPDAITDQEVCQFLVGLSRTRKACHLVAVRHYGKGCLDRSIFGGWISQHLEEVKVDKAYLEAT